MTENLNGGYKVGKCQAKVPSACRSSRCPDNNRLNDAVPTPINSKKNHKSSDNTEKKGSSKKKPISESLDTPRSPKGAGSAAEKRGLEYVKSLLPKGWKVDSTGHNSKLSDLEITDSKGRTKGYIEVKQLPSAAGGQIVISISGNVITSNSKNTHTPAVLDILKEHEQSEDSQYQKIPLTAENEEVVWDWMLTHWESKHVIAFYLTDKHNTYEKFVELNKIKDEASVVLSKRKKPSGSSSLPKKDYGVAKSYFQNLKRKNKFSIVEHDNRIFLKTDTPLDNSDLYHTVNDMPLYLSSDSSKCKEGEYEIKKTSVTNHMTIMMSMKLKGKPKSTPKEKTKEFFEKAA